ncbi:747_t:CDS:1, partial [Funneliformis caledonium]
LKLRISQLGWIATGLSQATFFSSAQLGSWRSIDKPSQAKLACKPARSACIYI